MDRRRLKFVILGVGIAASMIFLILAAMRGPGGFAYYMTVSEFLESEKGATDGFRVNGKVLEGSIVRDADGMEVRFVMVDGLDGPGRLAVQYHGVIPDTFVDGAEVVVEGRLDDERGAFVAHTLLAKCPSKYESADSNAETRASI